MTVLEFHDELVMRNVRGRPSSLRAHAIQTCGGGGRAVLELRRVFPRVLDDLDIHAPVENLLHDREKPVVVKLVGRNAESVAAGHA